MRLKELRKIRRVRPGVEVGASAGEIRTEIDAAGDLLASYPGGVALVFQLDPEAGLLKVTHEVTYAARLLGVAAAAAQWQTDHQQVRLLPFRDLAQLGQVVLQFPVAGNPAAPERHAAVTVGAGQTDACFTDVKSQYCHRAHVLSLTAGF